MKKLIFIFLFLLSLVIVAGCNARQGNETVHFDDEENMDTVTTTITQIDEDTTIVTTPIPIASTNAADIDLEPMPLEVTSFEGDSFTTNVGYHVIRGTAPGNTATVMVNDYKLQKFKLGDTTWTYIASNGIGTLEEGVNTYTITTLDSLGAELEVLSFTINYEAPIIPNLPDTGTSLPFILILSGLIAGIYTFRRRLLV